MATRSEWKNHEVKVGSLTIAGTAVTATPAEINLLSGAGAAVASGTQVANIADVTGETDETDVEARAAIADILDALEAFGIMASS